MDKKSIIARLEYQIRCHEGELESLEKDEFSSMVDYKTGVIEGIKFSISVMECHL